jgi:hypothetical protein
MEWHAWSARNRNAKDTLKILARGRTDGDSLA